MAGKKHYIERHRTMTSSVTVKCISCGHKKEVGPGEIPKGEIPMCDKCFNPMVAVSARSY